MLTRDPLTLYTHLYTTITTTTIMSSRKSGQAGFATKSMFDVLQNDEPEEEEVEEEDVSLDQVIEYVLKSLQGKYKY
jgi:uncharacterized protein YgfB (UPF0149 family)